jgi:hypothetical protein
LERIYRAAAWKEARTMSKLGSLMNGLTKSYLFTHLARDAVHFLRRNWSDLDLDRDRLLHRAGLQPYRPGSNIVLLCTGALVGAGIALALAPARGRDLRSQFKDRAMTLFNRMEERAEEKASQALS